nr:MAG TPA: hypothetical protein [Bacteriophage sp.]
MKLKITSRIRKIFLCDCQAVTNLKVKKLLEILVGAKIFVSLGYQNNETSINQLNIYAMTKLELNPEFKTKSNPEQIKEKFKMAAKITGIGAKAENGKTIKALKVTLANLETELKEANIKFEGVKAANSKKKYAKLIEVITGEIEATQKSIADLEVKEVKIPQAKKVKEVVDLTGKFRLGSLPIGTKFKYRDTTNVCYTFLGATEDGEAKLREANGKEFTAKVLNWKVVKVEEAV